ncbi:MAG: hypothetical protein LBK82_09015, partial [Planctomycetaceae bacterium]|nr:hypothetical protein [Planctomycetaceae bacterium]
MSDLVSTLALALESSKFNAGLKESGDLVDGLGNRTAHMTQTLKTASIALAGLFASSKVIGFTRSVINAASQAQDLDLKFRTVFKSIGYEAEKTSLKIQKEFNRTTGSAQQLLLTTGNVLTSMGIGQRTALQFAGKISELSIQIAALHGISEEAVSDAFSSAMMGQTRSLRSYGIAIEESALKAEIATQKKKGVIFATEKEARANAILTLSFKQSHNAIAAYSNISERYSEQSRKFQENLGELQEAIGDAFTKPAARVLSFANKYIEKFTSLDQSTIAFVSTVGLGVTSLGILASGYKIVTGVIGTYNAIQQAATAAQAIATEATKNNTAASTIDTETTLAHATATATDRTEVALRTSTIGKSVTTEKLAATETAKWTAALKANTATSATNRNEIATRTLAIDKIIATEKLATIETAKWTKALSLNANRFKNSEQIQLRSTVVKETATAEKFAAAETAKWTKALTLNASRFKNSKQIQLRATVIKEVATAEELVTVATNTWTTALQANSVALTQNIALAEKLASINPAALATQTVAGTAQTAIPANANTVPVTTAAKPITTAANRTIKIANDAAQTASQTAQTANNAATTATHTATTATRAATTATNAATVATRTAQTVTQTVTLGMANAGNHVSTMVAGNNVATNMNSASVGLNSVIMAGSALTPARKAIAAPATSLTQVPVPHPPKIPVPYQRVPVPHPPIDNVSKLYAASFLPFRKLADASRYVGGGIATGAKSLAFSTYNNVLPSMIAGGRSAVLNPGRTLATAALGVPNMIAGVPVRGVGLLTKSFSGLSKTLTTLAKHIPFVGKAFAGFLGPVGAIVGIGAGIWAGLKALKAAPMALEWVIDKVSNIFTKENISKVFSSALSMGKNVLSGAANLVAGAWHGIEEVGLRTIFAGVNFFSETKYKTD